MKTFSENAFMSIQKIIVKVNQGLSQTFRRVFEQSTDEILQVNGDVHQLQNLGQDATIS